MASVLTHALDFVCEVKPKFYTRASSRRLCQCVQSSHRSMMALLWPDWEENRVQVLTGTFAKIRSRRTRSKLVGSPQLWSDVGRITHAQRETKASFLSIWLAKLNNQLNTCLPLFMQILASMPTTTHLHSPPEVGAFRATIKLGAGNHHKQVQHKHLWCPVVPSLGSSIRGWLSYPQVIIRFLSVRFGRFHCLLLSYIHL